MLALFAFMDCSLDHFHNLAVHSSPAQNKQVKCNTKFHFYHNFNRKFEWKNDICEKLLSLFYVSRIFKSFTRAVHISNLRVGMAKPLK